MKSGRQNMAANIIRGVVFNLLTVITALILTGCWTPPNANVQPKGEPRLIQSGVPVESVQEQATVQAVDASQRIIRLKLSNGSLITCKVSQRVANFDQIQSGDMVKVTLTEELAIYVLKDGRLPVTGGTHEAVNFNAKVQLVDPSYRLLTLQYSNGQTEVLKTDLNAKLLEMQAGDAMILQTAEAKAIRIQKKSVMAHETIPN
jgi:translation initiation factor IF-1